MIAPTLSNLTWYHAAVAGVAPLIGHGRRVRLTPQGSMRDGVCWTIAHASKGWEAQLDTVFLAYIATGTGRLAGLVRPD